MVAIVDEVLSLNTFVSEWTETMSLFSDYTFSLWFIFVYVWVYRYFKIFKIDGHKIKIYNFWWNGDYKS